MVAVMHGTVPWTFVVCPCPVVSSTSRAAPGRMPVLEVSGRAFTEGYLGGGQPFAPVRGLGEGDGLDMRLPVSACIEPEQRHDGCPPRVGVENVGIVARGESLETRLEES